MANSVHPKLKQRLGRGEVDLEGDTLNLVGLDSSYTYTPAAHDTLADVTGVVATATITGRAVEIIGADTVLTGNDAVFAGVPDTANAIRKYLIVRQGAGDADSPILGYVDRDADDNPINVAPNGQDITHAWPDGKILQL